LIKHNGDASQID